MNVHYMLERLKERSDKLCRDSKELSEEIEVASDITAKLLVMCEDKGIRKVAIGMCDNTIPRCRDWPGGFKGSVFTTRGDDCDWSHIWGIVDSLGVGGGCGNRDQHQINSSKVIDGIYHCKDGKWFRKDES